MNDRPSILADIHETRCPMYTDDIVIMSRSPQGLQSCLDALEQYYKQWKLTVNNTRTKSMTINDKNRKYNILFTFGEKKLENVTEFTYLGIKTSSVGSFKPTLSHLRTKTERFIVSTKNIHRCKMCQFL